MLLKVPNKTNKRPLITGKKSIENYTDECIGPAFMVNVHTSSM